MELPKIDNYQDLLINDIPLIDVRAPIEFNQGAFPFAQNLPLMNDEERHRVGIRYKEQGQEKAIDLGHELVSDNIKHTRVNNWAKFSRQHPQGALYCFRGGLRSKISQQWIYDATGIMYPRISGGYKALRRFLINELETSAQQIQPLILGGRTGTGKTLLLNRLEQQIDLEGIFNHRGSAFGKHAQPQPSQIDIENTLSITLLKHRRNAVGRLVFEDEASNIGSRQVPKVLFNAMRQSPLIMLEEEVDTRINNVYQEYIIDALLEHQSLNGKEEGFNSWSENLTIAMSKIERRLGNQRYKELQTILSNAISEQNHANNPESHKEWIRILLLDYYDPMYDYQLAKKTEQIVFHGNTESVLNYLQRQYGVS